MTPNYWLSLAILGAPIAIALLGALLIRLVGRAAEKRVERSAIAAAAREVAIHGSAIISINRTTTQNDLADLKLRVLEAVSVYPHVEPAPLATGTYPTVPVTVWDLPPFARRRRSGESFTEFAERVGLT